MTSSAPVTKRARKMKQSTRCRMGGPRILATGDLGIDRLMAWTVLW
jgi:hypothetical protein